MCSPSDFRSLASLGNQAGLSTGDSLVYRRVLIHRFNSPIPAKHDALASAGDNRARVYPNCAAALINSRIRNRIAF